MPDNWAYVAAAYLLGALVLGGYWRHLLRRDRFLRDRPRRRGSR